MPGDEGPRTTLTIDPVERAVGTAFEEDRVDRDEVSRRHVQLVADVDVATRDDAHYALVAPPREERAHCGVSEELTLVLLQDALLEEAPEQHQRDEDAQRVEVRRSTDEVSLQAPGVRERDPEGDRQVEVRRPLPDALPCGAEEHASAHDHRQGSERAVDPLEEPSQRAAREARIHGDREDHHVHRDGYADAEARKEPASLRRVVLGLGTERVSERLDALHERPQGEGEADVQDHPPEGRVDQNVVGARLPPKELLDEPDAGAAVQPLDVDLDARRRGLRRCSLAQ